MLQVCLCPCLCVPHMYRSLHTRECWGEQQKPHTPPAPAPGFCDRPLVVSLDCSHRSSLYIATASIEPPLSLVTPTYKL